MTAGGSGGHITPILAVADELKRLRPDCSIVYIGQKGDQLSDIPKAHPAIDEVYTVSAGKFRRYHGEGWRQIVDVETQAKNIRDGLRVAAGIWQSYWLMRRLRPSIVFTRGGFVSVPVALGAALNGVPYITHDSDSTPSLANRIIARWAALHAVALPAELYPYPASKTVTVGVPVDAAFVPVSEPLQRAYRQELGLEQYNRMLFVTGGGNGSGWLNSAVFNCAAELLQRFPRLVIVHVAGRLHADAVAEAYDKALPAADRGRVKIEGFITGLYRYSGAADVIVVRAGASSLAEFAQQGKACVVIPARQLVWQAHHAGVLAKQGAIISLTEPEAEQDGRLGQEIAGLLEDASKRQALAQRLAQFARPDAAKSLAMVLLEQARS